MNRRIGYEFERRKQRERRRRRLVGVRSGSERKWFGERRRDTSEAAAEEETPAQPNLLLAGANRRAREGVRAHALPGRVRARTPRAKDRAARSAHPSVVLEPPSQVAPRGEAPQPAPLQQQQHELIECTQQ